MIPILGQLINKQYTYEAILCDPRKNELTILNYIDLTYSPKFKSFSELDIELQFFEEGHLKVKDKNFDLTKGLYLIKLNIKNGDDIVKSEFFFIENPSKNMSDGVITKSLHCYSYEYLVFNKKKLRGYNQTRKLFDPVNDYDINDSTKGGILNLMFKNLYNTWGIGYINPLFLNVFHTFDFADSTYTEVFSEIQKGYNCTILFNNVEQTINVYTNEEIGVNRDLVLSDYNYIKSISNEDKFDEIKSRLYVYGKDNTGINKYNPTGLSYVESYDFFINNGYFSSNLATAWNNYKALVASKKGQFEGYITQLETYEASLLQKQDELAALEAELAQVEDALDLEKRNPTNTSAYDSIYSDLQAKESQIIAKKNEINTVQVNINNVNVNITTLQNTLSYNANFSNDNLRELVNFVFEDTLNMSQISDSKQLYTYGLAYIEKVSQVPITFDVDSIDVFSTEEGQNDWNKINIADFININVPELGFNYYPIRLVSFNHNPIKNSLSITFSNTDKIESDILYLNDIFKLSNKVATEVEVKKYDYEKYSYDKNKVIYKDSVINNNIQLGNNFINRRGFIGSEIGALSGSKIQVFNDKICITTDNWATYHTLISGNGVFLQTENSQTIMHKDYGFAINVWNPALNSYRNAIYLGVDSSSRPALYIDNGYIQLNSIIDNVERYRIEMTPEKGFYIRANIGTQLVQNWVDRLKLTSDGYVVAKELRTDSDVNNFITLREQFIDFWNGGQKKLSFGFQDISGTKYPFSTWGTGSGINGGDIGHITKAPNEFYITHSTNNGLLNKIIFKNNDTTYPLGGIVLGDAVYFTNSYVNFNGASLVFSGTTLNFSGANVSNLDLGDSGTFETVDGKTVTVSGGVITNIV